MSRLVFSLVVMFSLLSNAAPQKVLIAAAENFSELSERNVGVAQNIRAAMQVALERYDGRLKKKGYEVSFKEFNFTQDDLSVLGATRSLVKSGAVAAIGYNTSNRALLAAPIHQKAKIPMVSTQATATRLSSFDSFVYAASVNNNNFAETLAEVAVKKLKAERAVSIVAVDCSYCTDLTETFRREFLALGAKSVEVVPILSEQVDFTDVLAKLKSKNFDVILNPNHKLLAGRLIVSLNKVGIRKPYLFADGWGSLPETLFFKILQKTSFEGYAVDHWHEKVGTAVSRRFVKDFQAKTGQMPDTLSALWFDSASLVLEALLKADKPTSEAVDKQIALLRDFKGVTGNFSFDRGPVPSKETVLLKAEGSNYSFESIIPLRARRTKHVRP